MSPPDESGLPHASGNGPAPEVRRPEAARVGRAIVVGASSGIGAALVRRLAGEGWRVAALARRTGELERLRGEAGGAVLVRAHDVQRVEEVPALFEELVRELGGLDLLIYAAGIMPAVGPLEFDTATDLEILRVNLDGCVAWCNPAADLFRTQRSGTIVGISSIAGDRGRKGNPAYCTSKAAMNTYLESLRNRLAEHGAHVCTIRPGYIDTRMTQGMDNLFWLISADEAARRILAAARRGANVRYVPFRWTWVGLALRSIPSFLFRRLNV
jgi:NAD(P)-dependent dehydrogenase (short-subunit alcohol dehydrogenase family)